MQTPGVVEAKVTALPDAPPVALSEPVLPTVRLGAADKVMTWAACGVTTTDATDAGPLPLPLVALTVQVIGVPLVRLVTVMGLTAPSALALPQVAV